MRSVSKVGAALGAAAVVVVLAGCQSGGSGSGGSGAGGAAAGVPMTIPQIEALLLGNSLESTTTDGRTSCAFHSTDTHTSNSMIVRGTEVGAGAFQGFYRIEPPNGAADPVSDPGLICYSYPDAGVFADCRSVRQSGSVSPGVTSVALYDRGGTVRATGTVRTGNTCGAVQ